MLTQALATAWLVKNLCLIHQVAWLISFPVVGSLNVSAYTFDDSTKAFANIRLSVTDVRPILQVDDDGLVITTQAKKIRSRDFPKTLNFLKMKFIVYKYVWENIHDSDIVFNRGLNVEAFALHLSDMYEDLGT